MKIKTCLLLPALLCFASCKTSKPNGGSAIAASDAVQETKKVTDTTAFIKNIVAQKSRYLNQEFGVLLKELDLPVKSYFPIVSSKDKNHVPGITISFDDRETTEWKMDHYEQVHVAGLRIIWATPVPAETYNELRQKSMANGNWSKVEEEFYAKQVIKEIK